ncbi:MAG: hypothetical protein IKQ46_15290 [Bacteroidales bacterium]|jgi:hypothetical protein|nr:hypothetical protein [Bacteroidales bacterium]
MPTTRICPYPGLRPFTEEESIFFKGRDLHIRQIVKLLEENKMAFITGASGDGKSSMVYAGVIPYIRAGFFKAKYNSWLIADFKPKKNPLESLAISMSKQINEDSDRCIKVLRQGFSALVDLYKNSEFYVTDGDDISNRGKNLLIIADQFEEVFTNSENFNQGIPSNESYTAINLLLETIRISITEKLPIYVIFTMRSDFISQCTVFKNLPEYIAYSQFFVPQLKRTEIRQIIEEPATMAGGKISSRLCEVIINNLNSGFDQLPVLQHALNLLWKVADNGAVEMDLIHLAKIAGISSEVLSPEDKGEFDRWYNNLPDYQLKFYEKPDLNNVLNAHAGILYESAYDYFMHNSDWAEKTITPEESKEIIEITFKSLTKVDNNRPVRNRCTLSEITGIINKDHITNATVCGVINIFRTPENSLIKPFSVPGQTETQYLSGDTVLDVTHEALIRNWKMLSEWDNEEVADMKDYYDFNSQMQLWIVNDKNPSYLLNSGNYTYFNQWFNRSNPNPYLFVKYDNTKLPQRQKLKNAQYKYENYVDFLEASFDYIQAKAKAVKRRITWIISGLVFFIMTLLYVTYWAMDEKSNAEQQKIFAEAQQKYAKEQQKVAENQRLAAETANEIAKQQRDTARFLAERALEAKTESDKARYVAELMRREAVSMRLKAEENFKYAEDQRLIAEGDRTKLQEQIRLTEEEKQKSAKLYDMAIANMLAMKAKNQYEDKKLNLRLVLTAYKLNERSENNQNSAELYDAMLFALEQNGFIQPMKTTNSKIIKFAVDTNDQIICLTNDAQIFGYKLVSGKTKETLKITKYQNSKQLIESAYLVDAENIVYSTIDKNTYYLNVTSQERVKLPSQNDFVKSASITTDKRYLVVAYQQGKVQVLNFSNPDSHQVANVNLKTRLADVNCALNNSEVYILTTNGQLIKWNISKNSQKTIFAQKNMTASTMVTIPNKRQLAVCFANGNIQIVDTKTDTEVVNMLGGHSGLQNSIYDSQTALLAISSVDKRISLINTNNLQEKPLSIEEHSLNRSDILGMGFSSDKTLFVLTADNSIRYFDIKVDNYIQKIISLQLMPLSDQEWKLILGGNLFEQ